MINDLTSFTNDFRLNKRLNTIARFKEIQPEMLSDTLIVNELDDIKNNLIRDKSIIRNTYFTLVRKLQFSDKLEFKTIDKKEVKQQDKYERYLSATSVIIILMLFCLILIPLTFGSESYGSIVAGLIGAEIVLLILGFFIALLLSFVPTFNKIWINHSINILFNFIILFILGYFMNRKKK
jgi:membrane-bound ClpP family serine protease